MAPPPFASNDGQASAYRAAIAINNMGVKLIERGCVSQAHATLQDAIVVMKSTFSPDRSNVVAWTTKLRAAEHRLAHPSVLPKIMVLRNQMLQVLDIDICSTPNLGFLLETSFSSTLRLLRIEHHEWCPSLDTPGSSCDLELISSIILFNFGLSNSLLSCLAPSPATQDYLQNQAVRIFRLALDVTAKSHDACGDAGEEAVVLVTYLLILKSILEAIFARGGQNRELEERYLELRRRVAGLVGCQWFQVLADKTAAPAA